MSKAFIARHGPAVLSALLCLAAFPPFNLGLLVFVAWVPWLLRLREGDGRLGFRSGLSFGFVFLLGQMAWLPVLVRNWTGSTALAIVPLLLAALAGQFYFGLAGWLMATAYRQRLPWLAPIAWAGVEVFRSYIPVLAFPWGLAAFPLWPYPVLIQHAFLGTIILVGAWVLLANVLAAELLAEPSLQRVRGGAMVWLVLLLASWVRFGTVPEGRTTAVTIGQPGVDLAFVDSGTQSRLRGAIAEILARATLHRSRFVVLPEGIARVPTLGEPSVEFARPDLPPVLFGGRRGSGPTYQSAFAYDGEWSVADKTRLVVFGEFVPGRNWIPFLDRFQLPTGDLTAGERLSQVEIAGVRVGPLLCFEGLFWDLADRHARAGAQMLAVMAIDDWYVGTAAPDQLAASAVWRAVETGLPTVRAASLGYSMAIDGRGRILARAPFGQTTALRVELAIPDRAEASPVRAALPWLFLAALPLIPFAERLRTFADSALRRSAARRTEGRRRDR
ncbi:MAG: apolipoprotein N-acyltransferase [Armatimonadetes bacterium]|nr:apolipoprotein N-acyltransferase [Armatimonadota bacterium]